MSERYIILTGGIEFGPLTIQEVESLALKKSIKATTMVRTESNGKWHLAASLGEIRLLVRKYNPSQRSTLERLGCFTVHSRDSANHDLNNLDPKVRIKLPLWKKILLRSEPPS